MIIYRPLKNTLLTQGFGENKPCVKLNEQGRVVRPYQFGLSTIGEACQPRYTKFYPTIGLKGHNGFDWKAKHGEPIYYDCNLTGEVIATTKDSAEGLGVVILTKEGDKYYKHRYWHLKGFNVKPGDVIRMGRCIGFADNTGASSGDHLHRDLKECDSNGNTLNRDNGYNGAIDINPFYHPSFVLDQLTRVHQLIGQFPFLRPVLEPLIYGR